jgi:GNAT superfamily N-acetyltransferase
VNRTAAQPLSIREALFDSPEVQRLITVMNARRRARMPEFTPSGGSTVEPSDFVAPAGVFLIAARDEEPVGCGGLRHLSAGVGEIKRLFVSPPARGQGIATALLRALEDRATSLGYSTVRLDTDGGVPAALALFRSQGYREIDDYNGNEYARYWFEKCL